jgi:hypothetical protein
VVVAAAGSLVAVILVFSTPAVPGIGHFRIELLLLLAIAIIVYRVLSFGTVAIQSIYGALSAYLMIGLMFAAFYAATASLASGPFFTTGAANTRTFQYFRHPQTGRNESSRRLRSDERGRRVGQESSLLGDACCNCRAR